MENEGKTHFVGDDCKGGHYPNLRALLEGRCGPISQWPVAAEVREVLEENERLRERVAELESNRSWVDRPRYERLRDLLEATETAADKRKDRIDAWIEQLTARIDAALAFHVKHEVWHGCERKPSYRCWECDGPWDTEKDQCSSDTVRVLKGVK